MAEEKYSAVCLVLGFLHDVQSQFTDNISETTVSLVWVPLSLAIWPVKVGPTVVFEASSMCNVLVSLKETMNASRWNTDEALLFL